VGGTIATAAALRGPLRGALLAAALAAAGASGAAPVTYRLEPDHSFVHFEVLHFGTSTIRGRFAVADGRVELDREARAGWVHLAVRTAGVDTGLPAFDERLRQPDLLASGEFPEATFTASGFVFDGDAVAAVSGELTLRGTSRPLTLRALHFGCRVAAETGREVCGGDFEGEVRRADFGASFGMPFVANRVRLVVQVEGRRE
jgi:polyisoprenoid-binding protein YceI